VPRLQDIENVLSQNYEAWLLNKELHGYESHTVSVFRVVKNVHTTVYGKEAGEEASQKIGDINCILVGDDFFPADSHSAGSFQEGWLYTTSDKVDVGDRVEVIRSANQGTRRYQVTRRDKVGTTRMVFQKFRLSALGD
jgi:hypothetical protein